MPEMTEQFTAGKLIITHPTGVVCEYDEAALCELLRKTERERDEADEELERVNYQIELLRGSKKNV